MSTLGAVEQRAKQFQIGSDKMLSAWCTKTGITVIFMFYHHFACSLLRNLLDDGTYLIKRNMFVLVLVHFIHNLGGLLLADIEAARLDQALEFFASDGS